jgi:hypothetical protein
VLALLPGGARGTAGAERDADDGHGADDDAAADTVAFDRGRRAA